MLSDSRLSYLLLQSVFFKLHFILPAVSHTCTAEKFLFRFRARYRKYSGEQKSRWITQNSVKGWASSDESAIPKPVKCLEGEARGPGQVLGNVAR